MSVLDNLYLSWRFHGKEQHLQNTYSTPIIQPCRTLFGHSIEWADVMLGGRDSELWKGVKI